MTTNGQQAQRATGETGYADDVQISPELDAILSKSAARGGNMERLSEAEKERVVSAYCRALDLNPLSQPITFVKMPGRGEVPYVNRGATDQLAAKHRLNRRTIRGPECVDIGGTKVVLCQVEVTHPNGRSETALATLPMGDPVNVYMKCETKAKRRGTLSILGLGLLDEMELETIPGAERVQADRPSRDPDPPAIVPPRFAPQEPPQSRPAVAPVPVAETVPAPVAEPQAEPTSPVPVDACLVALSDLAERCEDASQVGVIRAALCAFADATSRTQIMAAATEHAAALHALPPSLRRQVTDVFVAWRNLHGATR